MPILSSLLGALIGGKPEPNKPTSTPASLPSSSTAQEGAETAQTIEPSVLQQQHQQRRQNAPAQQEYLAVSDEPRSVFSPRSMKQLGLFAAGTGFLVLSSTITRRAVTRRTISALPRFYHPSHVGAMKQGNPDGPLIAAEALGLATLNVFAFGVMLTGGLSWAWDISSVDDLRNRARRKLYGEAGALDEDAEKQMEEWMARVLSTVKKEDDEKTKGGEGKKE